MDTSVLAFRVLAIGPLGINATAGDGKRVRWFREESIDEIMAELGVSAKVSVPRDLHEDGFLELSLHSFKDFKPDRLLMANEFTRNIKEARDSAAGALQRGEGKDQVMARLRQIPGLQGLDIPPSKGRGGASERPSSSVEEILKMVAIPDEQKEGGGTETQILQSIDSVLGRYLETLYGSEELRALESAWTGLKALKAAAKDAEGLEIGLVDCTHVPLDEIMDLLLVSLPLDLPTLMLFDAGFDNTPRSFALLEKVAELCEALLVPGVVELSPAFFALNSWDELDKRPYIPHYLEEQGYAKWQSLRKKPAARWLCAGCNRFLARPRWGVEASSKEVGFSEKDFLWVSPVWAVGTLCVKSVVKWGWPSRITDWRNCKLEDLPVRQVSPRAAFPTEAGLSEDRIGQFGKAGIIPLASIPNTDAVFTPFANTVGNSPLGFQLLLSMTAHFLMWCRDHFADGVALSELETGIRDILTLAWLKRGYDISDRIAVNASRIEKEGKTVIGLNIEPPREVLPGGGTISLEMPW